MFMNVKSGLEVFLETGTYDINGDRWGLLCNPASVDRHLIPTRKRIDDTFPGKLKALYSPQHGLFAEKQDNMIESNDRIDPLLGVPVFSLYGQYRIPDERMLAAIDTLIIDLQDVGTRVYTFIYTVSYCLEAAARKGIQVVILDRPNPVNGNCVEGNCLDPEYASFVGRYPIPMRHGMTIGEIALLFNQHFGIGCELSIIPMAGWQRHMHFEDTGLPWIAPSPNLPTPTSALVYPGQVLLEGTNVSEGRGTTQPFELFGAPYFDINKILDFIDPIVTEGVVLRPVEFEPTSNKWQGECCLGFQVHVTALDSYRPYRMSMALLQASKLCHPDQFKWKKPPYEYEYVKRPIDLIIGSRLIRKDLEKGISISQLEEKWSNSLNDFILISKNFYQYH
jgi:uncharacterized protein YbbC (DUF1343 family)